MLLLTQAGPAPAPTTTTSPRPAETSLPPADDAAITGVDGAPLSDPNATGTRASPDPFGGSFLFIIGGMFLVMIFFSINSGRKEKKKKAELLASLAKGSKVQTIGGILGTVVEVRDDELIVKVDENSNTRLRFAKSAVTTVLS